MDSAPVGADSTNHQLPRVECAGAVIADPAGAILLVKRANAPHAGTWSLPSGRLEPGEDPAAGAARETLEETGLVTEVHHLLGTVERPGDGCTYVIHDYWCTVSGGHLNAGDDALDAAWVTFQGVHAFIGDHELPLAPGLAEALVEFGVI